MENKPNGEEPRTTLNIKKSTAAKFDLLRFGNKSWDEFLQSIYLEVARSRKHILTEKLRELEKEIDD